jgi:arylamine N-acetyltransferase
MTANPCFGRLLSKLGFVVRHLLGRVSLPGRGWAKRDDHCLLMVRCTSGGWYLVDIAFGDSSRTPIPLTSPRSEFPAIVEEPSVLDADWIQREANTTDVAGHHYIRNLTEHDQGPGHLLYAVTKDTGRTAPFVLYGFNLERRSWPEDFAEVYDFLIRSPESIFTNVLVCTLALPYGRVSVNAREVVTFDSRTGIRTKSSYHSLEELSFILQTHFGMNMSSLVSGRLVKPLLELSSVALVS